MNFIRQQIKNILEESFGVHEPTDKLSMWLSKALIDNLNYHHEHNTLNFTNNNVTLTFTPPKKLIEETLINLIQVKINIPNNIQNSINGGNFDAKQTKQRVVDNLFVYDINININLNWDYRTDISTLLTSFFEHELHHASIYIIKQQKASKTKHLNMIKNMPIYGIYKQVEKNPALRDFMNHFYLALPEEINARVQEAYSDIKKYKNQPSAILNKNLYKTRAFGDANKMIQFNSREVLSLPKEVLENFINEFNANMKAAINLINLQANKDGEQEYAEQNTLKYPKTDITAFFEFWRKRINKEGYKLFHKLIKMAGSAKNLNEIEIRCIPYIDSLLLEEMIGFVPFDYDTIDYL